MKWTRPGPRLMFCVYRGGVMKNLGRAARVYLIGTYVTGAVGLVASWWLSAGRAPLVPLLIWACASAASAPFRIHLPVFGKISIAFTFVFAALIQAGPLVGALSAGLAGLVASLLRRPASRPPLHRTLFNSAELILSTLAAGAVLRLAGAGPGEFDPVAEWLPVLLATGAFFIVNTCLVSGAIGLTEGLRPIPTWTRHFPLTAPAYLAGAFLASTLVVAMQQFGVRALLLALPLMYVVYFALWIYLDRLRQEVTHGKDMANVYLKVIEALALAIDAKDRTTQRHVRRVQTFAVELGRTMGLPPREIEALKAGALLHDIGKLAVPEHILCKPGRLSGDELDKMQIHPRIGAEILETVQFPFPLTSVVRSHHEKWDGTGYPDRLKGEEIPLPARILSVVDCYDALTSDRPYRKPLTKEEALKYVQSEAGTAYDPKVVEALVGNLDRLETLAAQINLTRETSLAPDKRKLKDRQGTLTRDANEMRASVMDSISSAHRELYALYELAQSISRSLNLDEAMAFISSKIARLIHYRCLILYLHDRERGVLRAHYVTGRDASRLQHHVIRPGERMSGWAAVHRQPILGRIHGDPVRREGTRSDLEELLTRNEIERLENAIVAPLLDGDHVLGVLALYDRPDRPYEEDDLRVISIIARHVSNAIKNALLYGATKESALTDPLTRLPNARYLFVSFEEEIARAMRQQVPLSIIELDVNDFKKVNDQHGHPAGDRILRSMARLIRSQLRGCDTCVRYAGNEFIVIIPGVGRQEVGRTQARIQQAIEANKFAVHGGRPARLTVSMGSASFPEDGRTFEALIAVADARLYETKHTASGQPADGEGYQRFAGRRDVPVN
jgi:diguanylate cyclase (GGDEF)-like protein/putative nucleotidyltransferase with HDIG domain